MLFDYWAKTFEGKAIDYDKVYGVQCVDLIKHYVRNVIEIIPQSIGNAIDYYNKRYTEPYLTQNFDWIDNTPEFVTRKGDIGVFKTNSRFGHIVVCNGVGDTHTFQAYDENHNGTHAPMTLRTFRYNDGNGRVLLGVHRPKNQANIIVSGWMLDDDGWYYVNDDGTIAESCWITDSQGWLYLDANGRIVTNQWEQDSRGWLYLGEDGHPITSRWMKDSTDWCYLDSDGYMLTNAWIKDSQGWCFVINDGHILRDGYASDSEGKHYIDQSGHIAD